MSRYAAVVVPIARPHPVVHWLDGVWRLFDIFCWICLDVVWIVIAGGMSPVRIENYSIRPGIFPIIKHMLPIQSVYASLSDQ